MNPHVRILVVALIGMLIGVALMAPGLFSGPSFDAAVFTAVADRLLAGDLPYVDAWDHKPPLVYFAHGAVQWAFGWWLGPWLPVWGMSVALTGGVAAVMTGVLDRMGYAAWWAAIGGWVSAILVSLYVVSLGGGLTEPLATFPLALALWTVLDPRPRLVFVGGALGGIAILGSFLAAPGVAALGLYVLLQGGRLAATRFAVAFAAVLGAAAAAAFVAGALPAALDALVRYGGAYRAANLSWRENYLHAEAAVIVLALAWVAIPVAVGSMRWLRARTDVRHRRLALAFAAWVLLTVAAPVYLGRFETHYVAPLAVPLSVLAVVGAADVVRRRNRPWAAFVLVTVAWSATVGLSATIAILNATQLGAAIHAESRRTKLVAGYLAEQTTPDAAIWVWGNEPHLYYLAAREPASRFLYLLPLTTPGYASPELIEDVLAEWAAEPPELIVDAGSLAPGTPGDPPLLIDRPVVSDGRSLDILEPLRAFVRERYHPLTTIDGWPIYRLD